MASNQEFQPSWDYIKAQERLLSQARAMPHSQSRARMSDATQIFDTDYDSDSLDATSDGSPYGSGSSLMAESVTTLSTVSSPDEIKTPESTGLTGFHFQIDDSPTKGPQGPHLFRSSEDSLSRPQLTPDWSQKVPDSAAAAHFYTSFPNEQRKDSAVPENVAPTPPPPSAPSRTSNRPESTVDIAQWSPNQVVRWMQGLGFDEPVTEKFLINDISGAILLELQIEDLKELEIASFGKRHQLMACIKKLRECQDSSAPPSCDSRYSTPDPSSRLDTRTPQTTAAQVNVGCTSPFMQNEHLRARSGSRSSDQSQNTQQSRQKRGRRDTDIAPQDSVSIVAIEQLLPKVHVCSKGENCRKWQKQQSRFARLLKDFQLEGLGGSVLVAGDAGNAATAQSIAKTPPQASKPSMLDVNLSKSELKSPKPDTKTPKSDVTPSLIASSDLMGADHEADIRLSQERLDGVKARDPQENVRNFLNFQRLSALQPVTDPSTPPGDEMCMEDSPRSEKPNQTLANNLRHLPKLRIPSMNAPSEETMSPNYSAVRTVTPSVCQKARQFPNGNSLKSTNLCSSLMSPSDFYRSGDQCSQGTPVPDEDPPLTAVPINPVERGCSQSVPPDMRFGNQAAEAPVMATKPDHRRLYSAVQRHGFQAMVPVAERSPLPPIDTLEDLEKTSRVARYRNNPFSPGSTHADDIIHSGWMKKRKTSKLIRREWEDHHFTLRGTNLCMYPDEDAAQLNSKALERIDVDDYAVACSSLQSSSKLTAAFKKTVLKRVNDSKRDAAFAFSLIPSSKDREQSVVERKPLLPSGPKSHHFSVKTQEERIDWMRELMLAKALRRGRESGDAVNRNGEPF